MGTRQTEGKKITALYERLSRDDESHSIINQKRYLEGYAADHGYGNISYYMDDRWSGGNFDRSAWKQLIADIEAGKVEHLLVKDLSRVGRDCLQTGFYTEVVFKCYGIHFVAIGPTHGMITWLYKFYPSPNTWAIRSTSALTRNPMIAPPIRLASRRGRI